jgi:hypothetical protein
MGNTATDTQADVGSARSDRRGGSKLAVAILQRFPEGAGAAEYDVSNDMLDPARNPAEGLIFHCAGEYEGRFQVFDVWESREHFDRLVEERLIPVQKEMMGEEAFAQFPGLEIVEAPVHNYFVP